MANVMLTVSRIVREHIELVTNESGPTIGHQVDEQIQLALLDGAQVSEIALSIPDDAWDHLVRFTGAPPPRHVNGKPKSKPAF